MKQIKAKDIKPGMEVEWTQAGVTRKCVAETVDSASPRYGVNLHTSEGGLVHIPGNAEVTVLSEPTSPQPEEPTWFGARVVVDGDEHYVRTGNGSYPWGRGDGCLFTWAEVCEMGPVTVVPDQGWKVPAETELTPEVPERIEEWPEDDQ